MQLPNRNRKNHSLRTERLQRQWSQRELAERVGATVATVKRWERRVTVPGPYFRLKLTALFGKSEEELGLGDVISLPVIPPKREASEEVQTSSSPTNLSKLWTIPYQRNLSFTGRDPVLEHLHTVLTHQSTRAALTQSYAIYGLGGIGKTQLAIEYAYRHRSDYDAVLWVEAETQTTLVSSFMILATLLTLPEKTEEDQAKIVAAVLRWLNGHERWLLIFDNVEDLSLLKPFLPASDQGALLFTTRLQSLGTLAQRVELPPMTIQEGCAFLLARTNRLRQDEEDASIDPQEMAVAQQIVSEMGGLPLALEQAGAYIDATKCGLSDYFHLFQTVPQHLLDMHERSSDHLLSVSRTFALVLEQVEQHNPLAAELLTACAFLAPDAIPEMFFLQGASSLGPTFEALATDPLIFPEALKVLLSYSLLQRNATTHTITVHRLVQAVLKGQLTETVQHAWARRMIEVMSQLFPADMRLQVDSLLVCEQLLSHAQVCLLLGDVWDEDKTLRIPLMSHVATYLTGRVRYTEAERLFERAVQMGEQALGLEHPLVAEALYGLAEIYRMQSKYEEAESLFVQVLHIREHTLGAEHPSVANTFERLGNLYNRQGKYEQAESLYQRALCIFEQAVGSDCAEVTMTLNGLGVAYDLQGKYGQAEPLYQRALHIQEKEFGPESAHIAPPLNNLGELYRQQGKYEQAEPLYQRSLCIFEQTIGSDCVEIAHPLNNLGELYRQQGKYEQAEPLYQRALHIWEQALGPNHSVIATPLNGLANLYREQGLYEQAEPLYQQALRLRQQHLDLRHPDIAETLYDLACFHHVQQQTTEALSLYQQALTILEQTLGPQHPQTGKTRTAYTQLLQEVGQIEKAATAKPQMSERASLCACGCARKIDTSKSRGESRRFFSGACKQRFYRNARTKSVTQWKIG